MATFQSSDRNFLQYRAFGYLHSRVLSDMQFDIEQIEGELDDLDRWEKTHGDVRKLSCRRRDSHRTPEELAAAGFPAHFKRCRPVLLSDLRLRLLEYGKSCSSCPCPEAVLISKTFSFSNARRWCHCSVHPVVTTKVFEHGSRTTSRLCRGRSTSYDGKRI